MIFSYEYGVGDTESGSKKECGFCLSLFLLRTNREWAGKNPIYNSALHLRGVRQNCVLVFGVKIKLFTLLPEIGVFFLCLFYFFLM
jgi:hypothetical protein